MEQPERWTNYYSTVYKCNHPVYDSGTLYLNSQGKGLVVIQQRFDPAAKSTHWGPIDPWLGDRIYLTRGFQKFFKERSDKKDSNGLYPTVAIRQIMWALRMKPIPRERWETVFDRKLV